MILTVTINPAMDIVLRVEALNLNVTNRIQSKYECVGGKGTHISVNLSRMGVPSMAVGVVRGRTGKKILDALRLEPNIQPRFLCLEGGDSRTNYILVDNHAENTIVAERGCTLTDGELDALVALYAEVIGTGDLVVISGDASNHNRETLQDELIDIAVQKGARLCLDVSGTTLERGIKKSPFFVKPNLEELRILCKKEITTTGEIVAGMRELANHNIPHVVVSCGNNGCLALSEGRLFRVTVPRVLAKNTAGCGDSLVAGLIAGFEQNLSIESNLRRANAIASAAAMNEETAGFDVNLIEQLSGQVVVEEWPGDWIEAKGAD